MYLPSSSVLTPFSALEMSKVQKRANCEAYRVRLSGLYMHLVECLNNQSPRRRDSRRGSQFEAHSTLLWKGYAISINKKKALHSDQNTSPDLIELVWLTRQFQPLPVLDWAFRFQCGKKTSVPRHQSASSQQPNFPVNWHVMWGFRGKKTSSSRSM